MFKLFVNSEGTLIDSIMKRTILIALFTMLAITALVFQACKKDEPNDETPDSITDPRDGQTYNTVKIGNQTWFAENLSYETTTGSWLYDNSSECLNGSVNI